MSVPISEAFNMDCMEYMAGLPDKAFELAIVDPPYFTGPDKLGYYGKGYYSSTGVVRKEYESIGIWDIPEQTYFNELRRVSKNQIIWGINYFHFAGLMPGRIVWDKVNGASSFSDCEIAYNSMTSRVDLFRYMWNGMLQGKNISEGFIQRGDKSKNEKRIHPTQKPVDLYKWLLSRYAKPGDKILDTHLGSGSSRIASYDMGFDFYATELDKDYFDASIERFITFKMQENLFTAEEIFLPQSQDLFQEATK